MHEHMLGIYKLLRHAFDIRQFCRWNYRNLIIIMQCGQIQSNTYIQDTVIVLYLIDVTNTYKKTWNT